MNPDAPYCFVICSFASDAELEKVHQEGLRPAVERFGFAPYRLDQIPYTGSAIDAMLEHIARADFVVADLSGERPNCYYEVGYAHALGRPVVHLINDCEQPQFNVGTHQFLRYRSPAHLRTLLEDYLLTNVLTTIGPADPDDLNKGKFGRRAFVDPFIVTGRLRLDDDDEEDDEDDDDGTFNYIADVCVRSVDPRRPLQGKVTFQLHESFKPRKYTTTAKHGVARCDDIQTYGTFTLGIMLHRTGTLLELDLGRLPGAGSEFRRR